MDWEYHRKKFYRKMLSPDSRYTRYSAHTRLAHVEDVLGLMEYWQENLGGYGYRYGVPDDDGR